MIDEKTKKFSSILGLKKNEGVLPITHADMTRFNISLQDGVDMVMYAIENHIGGEIFVPKIPSFKITDLAKAINPKNKIKFIGMRKGEKIHEELITASDDGALRLCSEASKSPVKTWTKAKDLIYSLDVTTDGKRFFGGSENGQVYEWDRNGKIIRTLVFK